MITTRVSLKSQYGNLSYYTLYIVCSVTYHLELHDGAIYLYHEYDSLPSKNVIFYNVQQSPIQPRLVEK